MQQFIFVFGSNLAGRHGKGAALTAHNIYDAKMGVGVGPTGNAYAIPTKDEKLRALPLPIVERHIAEFCEYARANPAVLFLVTPVGTGLAGYDKTSIARIFRRYQMPPNCLLTSTWLTG